MILNQYDLNNGGSCKLLKRCCYMHCFKVSVLLDLLFERN